MPHKNFETKLYSKCIQSYYMRNQIIQIQLQRNAKLKYEGNKKER